MNYEIWRANSQGSMVRLFKDEAFSPENALARCPYLPAAGTEDWQHVVIGFRSDEIRSVDIFTAAGWQRNNGVAHASS